MGRIAALTLTLLFATVVLQAQDLKFRRADNHVPNGYIVVLRSDVADAAKNNFDTERLTVELTAKYGGKTRHVFDHVLKGYAAEMSAAAAERLARDPRVEYVEEDGAMRLNQVPVGLDRIDQRDLPLDNNYVYYSDGTNVTVYVVDSGLYTAHFDFGTRAANVYDAVNDGQNGNDCNGHGTAVAGVLGGATYGVAKNVQLRGVRVADCNGSVLFSNLVAGLDWVKNNRTNPAVVNLSLGDGGGSSSVDTAVNNLIGSGVTVVAAAGNLNDNACNHSPARVAGAITAAGSDTSDQRLSEPTYASNYGSCVDVFAPSKDIQTTTTKNSTDYFSGTSFAAPHVAGFAAQYLSKYPNDTVADVTAAVQGLATLNKITNAGSGSPNLLLYTKIKYTNGTTSVSSSYSGCSYTGTVSAGDGKFVGAFAAGQGGNPSLAVEKEVNGVWYTVASANAQNLKYFGTGGNYRMRACVTVGGYGWFVATFNYPTP